MTDHPQFSIQRRPRGFSITMYAPAADGVAPRQLGIVPYGSDQLPEDVAKDLNADERALLIQMLAWEEINTLVEVDRSHTAAAADVFVREDGQVGLLVSFTPDHAVLFEASQPAHVAIGHGQSHVLYGDGRRLLLPYLTAESLALFKGKSEAGVIETDRAGTIKRGFHCPVEHLEA